MAVKKSFPLGVGNYYFTIRNAGQNGILIKRKTKEEAARSFLSYTKVGKDCDWHGRWAGKKFEEVSPPSQD